MAEVAKEKKKNIFVRIGNKIGGFFKGIAKELKKVTWPTKSQVVNNTLSVLVFCLIVGSVIWVADFAFQEIIGLLFR